jgi:nitrate reductase NapE component
MSSISENPSNEGRPMPPPPSRLSSMRNRWILIAALVFVALAVAALGGFGLHNGG